MNDKVTENIDDKVNAIYQKAVKLKEIARKSLDNINFYIEAAKLLREAAEIEVELIENEQNIDKKVQYEAFSLYYFYEEQDCLSAHYYEKRDIERANFHRQSSEKFIDGAIKTIKNIPEQVSPNIRQHLIKLLPSWEYHQQTDIICKLGNDARAAWDSRNYIDAFDIYRKQATIQEEIIRNFDKNLEPKYKRITTGNLIGSMVNASSAMVMMVQESHNKKNADYIELSFEMLVKLLKYAVDAYLLGESAFHNNPEWKQYYENAQHCLKNIKSTLLLNSDVWEELYMAFEDNQEFLRIMKMTDSKRFKIIEGKRFEYQNNQRIEINMNKPTFNNIDINNSQVGMLNTGSIENVQQIDINISTLNESGNKEVGQAISLLAEAISKNQEISDDTRTELLDQVKLISEEATVSPEKRKTGLIKPILNGLAIGIGSVASLAQIWSMCGDIICKFFNLENPFKS